jgi:hypothetical protein
MAKERGPAPETRRDFLVLAGGAVGALGLTTTAAEGEADAGAAKEASPLPVPAWVHEVTRMGFLSPAEVAKAAASGAQVVHTNLVWPYFPLRRAGGGLSREDDRKLRALAADCRRAGVRLVLGLPPFPPVSLVKKHPDWRVHPDDSTAARRVEPKENDLGTRLGCNLGPWGDYFIDVCVELLADYGLDGYSFDGNYHPPLCFCPACKTSYRRDKGKAVPARANLDDLAYREYLVWRGERLEDHYRRLQQRLKKARPDAVLMSWTVNAGRWGHFLHSPRAMPTRLNRLFDLPMQEWWLDETNVGASLLPVFGASYLRATVGDRPCAAEPYLMARGNPYGTDSFPSHERTTRCLLALTCGNVLAESFGWPGHNVADDFRQVARLEKYLTRTTALPWAGMLVSEQARQFYAYRNIAERFLPHPLGVFRASVEAHFPLTLVNDWDLSADALARFAVIVLPNAAALSDAQVAAVRAYVRGGGGLVATGETSLCNELGVPRRDFALADLFGVSFRGRFDVAQKRPKLDENFAWALDEAYWKQRVGVGLLSWGDHPLVRDRRLKELVPHGSVRFRGPLVRVSEPANKAEVVVRVKPEGAPDAASPAIILRQVGKGRMAYFAAGVDAALWSYAYPYQRLLLTRALEWAARTPMPISVRAPLCVHVTHFVQNEGGTQRTILHFFNGVNTTANHGLPAMDVPLREEVIPIHGIEVTFHKAAPKKLVCEPGGRAVTSRREGADTVVTLPPLEVHFLLVAEG